MFCKHLHWQSLDRGVQNADLPLYWIQGPWRHKRWYYLLNILQVQVCVKKNIFKLKLSLLKWIKQNQLGFFAQDPPDWSRGYRRSCGCSSSGSIIYIIFRNLVGVTSIGTPRLLPGVSSNAPPFISNPDPDHISLMSRNLAKESVALPCPLDPLDCYKGSHHPDPLDISLIFRRKKNWWRSLLLRRLPGTPYIF